LFEHLFSRRQDVKERLIGAWTTEERKGKVLRVSPSGRFVPRNQRELDFWKTKLVTEKKSLHRSCWTELTCQGILLPSDLPELAAV
jgi:hypothetical protein